MHVQSIAILAFATVLWVELSASADGPARAASKPSSRPATRAARRWAQPPEARSVQAVCRDYPAYVRALFAALDLDRPGLEAARAAAAKQDWPGACEALLAYYRSAPSGKWLRRRAPEASDQTDSQAEKMLDDRFTIYSLTGKVPRRANGRLNWMHAGPNGDVEWRMALNRHHHLRRLLEAWSRTGNKAYARLINDHLWDWATAVKAGKGAWGTSLDVSFRSKHWAEAFYGLIDSDALTPATRILALARMNEHARQARRRHRAGSNFATMEMSGLAAIGAAWPEFKASAGWLKHAQDVLARELKGQFLPDGVQHELASHYHWVSLGNYQQFSDILDGAGIEVRPAIRAGMEKMWNYMALSMRPDGRNPLNNDSDLNDYRARVLAAARRYDRPDWIAVATGGREGRAPEPPSAVFPHAGQLIMRGGLGPDAHWAFFDAGPLGRAHQHYDKLHLSVTAFGRDLLTDSGRYTYKGGAWRGYFVSSAAHNVVLMDGRGQGNDDAPKLSGQLCVIRPEFDYARGTMDRWSRLKGGAAHTRAVLYVRGRFWLVADRLVPGRRRRVQALWHFHPHCTVAAGQAASVASTDKNAGNLRIVPLGEVPWTVRLVRGQKDPLQGWYSERYNVKAPATVAEYAAEIEKPATCVWLLMPARGTVPQVKASVLSTKGGALRVRLEPTGQPAIEATIPLTAGQPAVTISPS